MSRDTIGHSISRGGIFLYVTFPSEVDIPAFAKKALESRLAGCVNVLQSRSIYMWQGDIRDQPESIAIFKTHPDRESELRTYIEENHPYDVPCIARLDPSLNPAFAEWLEQVTGPMPPSPVGDAEA